MCCTWNIGTDFITSSVYKEKRTSEGTAEWASFDDLKESDLLVSPNKTDKKTGIVLGTWYSGLVNYEKLHNFVSSLRKMAKKIKWKWSDEFFYTVLNVFCSLLFVSRYYIVDNFDTHTFLCAPSRSGKGIGPIIQTLLFWKDSMIVSDLKRENIRETGPYRKYVLGHNVLEFAPTDTRPTARFNPINEIRWGTPNEGQDVSNIVTLLVGKPEGKDAHWKSNAISLIIGALTHLKYKHAHINAEKDLKPGDDGYIETNFYHVYEWLTTTDKNEVDEYMTLQEKIQLELDYEHFPVVLMVHNESIEKPMIRREITLERAQEITTFSFEALKTPKKHPVIISCFNNFLSKPESEGGSVLSTAVTALIRFDHASVDVDNWKNRISPSMEGYKTCSLSSLRSTIMVAKNAAEIHEKNILAMLQDTPVISEYEACLSYLKNLPDNYLAISEDLKCFMNESR